MKINSDINVLGGLSDWNLVSIFLEKDIKVACLNSNLCAVTAIKTDKSVRRYEHAIKNTLLKFNSKDLDALFRQLISSKGLDADLLIFLFWNTAINHPLFHYLNEKVFFPAFYNGRISIKHDEVVACIRELSKSESVLQRWSESSVTTTASKYLTLLKKFGLMEGAFFKTIRHPYLSDEMFIIYVYWLAASIKAPNILRSEWMMYGFIDLQSFLDRLMQVKFSKFFHFTYTGDKLTIETLIDYMSLYDSIHKS